MIPSNFACLDLTRLARGLAGRIREGPAKGPSGMAANYAESDVGIPITRGPSLFLSFSFDSGGCAIACVEFLSLDMRGAQGVRAS